MVKSCWEQERGKLAANHPGTIPLLLEFEAIGGMATATMAEVIQPLEGEVEIQGCVAQKLTPLLLTFQVEDGTYGYCEETMEPIAIRRLEARPIATLSIEAQERHERMERTHREE